MSVACTGHWSLDSVHLTCGIVWAFEMVLAQLTPEESKVLSAVRLEEAMALWFLKS